MNPVWSALACGVVFAGWCIGRIRGDSVFQGMFLGLVMVSPFAIDGIENLGWFEWMRTFVVNMTSLVANLVGEPHAIQEWSIMFGRGTADHYETIGVWDSVLGLLGVALFIVLAFRRSMLPAAISLLLCFFVWAAVRSIGWVTIALWANQYETWYAWSFELELVLFSVGVVLVFSVDRFIATVFEPIPFENFNTESPLGAFVWNWICGLPRLTLRIPKRNKISQRWRTLLHIAKKKPSFRTDFNWIRIEFFDILIHPLHAIGSAIDAVRGWKDSRNWKRFFLHFPPILLMAFTYITVAFYATKRIDNQTQFLSEESQKLCSTDLLEAASKQEQELGFCNAIKAAVSSDEVAEPIPDATKRVVKIQCINILATYPSNVVAKYRLALIYAINKETERATTEMTELVSGKFGEFPQADAWLAKRLIILNGEGVEVQVPKLLGHLGNASKWKKTDSRLLFFYARLLEERGEHLKAGFIANKAVAVNPELFLELAKLQGRIGEKDASIKTALEAENYFFERINSESEREMDWLAVADARLLSERPEEAVKVLKEGLARKPDSKAIRRQLCKFQLLFYAQSVKKKEDGTFEVDLSLLETASDTDPKDPSISSEIAKLLPLGLKPTPKLLGVLKSQIDVGIVSVPSLLMLGEAFYSQGKFESARKYWELALEKEPENFAVLNNLATCLVVLSTENADRAIEMVDRAIEMVVKADSIYPNNPDILDTFGEVLLMAKRPKEAIPKLERVIRQDPNRIETRRKLLSAYEASGMPEMARIQSGLIQRAVSAKEIKSNN